MSADRSNVVNLRQARKRRDRDAREREAEANRRLHGRSGAEKRTEKMERDRAERLQDGHRLTDEPNPAFSGDDPTAA